MATKIAAFEPVPEHAGPIHGHQEQPALHGYRLVERGGLPVQSGFRFERLGQSQPCGNW